MRQSSVRPPLALALLLAVVAAGCSDATANSNPPSAVRAVSATSVTTQVDAVLPQAIQVQVVDDRGTAVRGVSVVFSVQTGEAVLSPTVAVTDGQGRASAQVTVGHVAGLVVVNAEVVGLDPVSFVLQANPGPLAGITLVPRNVRLASVGATGRFRVGFQDQYRNQLAPSAVTWTSLDPGVFTVDDSGLVTVQAIGATGRLVATTGARADTGYVIAGNAAESRCKGYGAGISFAVGQVVTADPATMAICVTGTVSTAEYIAVPVQQTTVGGSMVGLEVAGSGVGVPTPSYTRGTLATAAQSSIAPLARDGAFDLRLRELGRTTYSKQWSAASASLGASDAPLFTSTSLPPGPKIGSLVSYNASAGSSCTVPETRTGRVVAVTNSAIVLADTGNPSGGFTDAEYTRYGIAFDTLVTQVDEAAFGLPTDVDKNGREIIFFTRAVNELSLAGSRSYVGGFFHPRDVLTKQQCPTSNAAEMFYILVPDPYGEVKTSSGAQARAFSKAFVDSVVVATLAHEYQHLINAFGRAYVTHAPVDEEDWLNEGLSHIAEELVFYRETKTAPGQNIGGDRFADPTFAAMWTMYQRQNSDRLKLFMSAPEGYSPWTGTDLSSRGAVWAFLRYAADQRAPGQTDVWRRLVDSKTSGVANLESVFGADIAGLERDWRVSLVADDWAAGAAAQYQQPSWNFRTLYPATPGGGSPYPLHVSSLSDNVLAPIQLAGGASAYFRFTVAAGADALVRVTSASLLPAPTVQFMVIRTK